MKITKTRQITVERERFVTVRFKDETGDFFCRECGKNVRFVSANAAALLCETTARRIFRRIEAGEIHFAETDAGAMLVCFRSVVEMPNENPRLPIVVPNV